MASPVLVCASLLGAVGVALGAFGAHGLEPKLLALADGAKRLAWWDTATRYLMWHALSLALSALVAEKLDSRAITVAHWGFGIGCLLFSGSLYAMTLGAPRWFGAITPFGGLAFIAGWLALAYGALRG